MQSVLEDPLLLSQLRWRDIEDLLVMEVLSVKRREPLSASGLLNIERMDDGVFRTYFRFEKNDIRRLKSALLLPDTVYTAQRVSLSGEEALCITLRRLAYPNRLIELERLFGRHYSVISAVTNSVLTHIEDNFGHLLCDVNNHEWLNIAALEEFSQAYCAGAKHTHSWRGLFKDSTTASMVILHIR
ncbi:hypothetical protein HPB50_016722 [Hyalomma asiaticum]|uniref:Uncharacterized protein n=3 Tax=Hyalomma asiaticum TaxID=266040 RepID=A0ACB7RKC3_HYAAI|nr:hypothetical protein HPB50_021413 [Hyalomma asiaticum]KAH6923085.1 hypothetical protein HPB50_021415 [Hyalomma asiaticum]KAH6933592.1 hypothetical protein HPB50_016722 [Hyalomma asiaticum]